jgi:hypothetical protein
MPAQADILMERLKKEQLCDWNNDWKVITFFVGVSSFIQIGFFFILKLFFRVTIYVAFVKIQM